MSNKARLHKLANTVVMVRNAVSLNEARIAINSQHIRQVHLLVNKQAKATLELGQQLISEMYARSMQGLIVTRLTNVKRGLERVAYHGEMSPQIFARQDVLNLLGRKLPRAHRDTLHVYSTLPNLMYQLGRSYIAAVFPEKNALLAGFCLPLISTETLGVTYEILSSGVLSSDNSVLAFPLLRGNIDGRTAKHSRPQRVTFPLNTTSFSQAKYYNFDNKFK